ncbi:MAG: phosphoenolpyruvate carboxykinase (ATP) [Pseudomonadota bacterium]
MSGNNLKQVLRRMGLKKLDAIYWNLSTPALIEASVRRRESHLAHHGALVVRTGVYTGRAANDKFIVDEPSSREKIWWGDVNQSIAEENFDALYQRACTFLEGQEVFVQDCLAGADPKHEMPVRVITQEAWHSLFARNMFLRPANSDRDVEAVEPHFTVLHVPHFHANPESDGTNSEAFITIHFGKRIVLIGGTSYAGEIKKSIFTVMNYLLPQKGVMSMHASANMGKKDDVAIFFGLSGTGKTTLSADPNRKLIGDDETGWDDDGVFNIEGGCYAKVIRLSRRKEPEIYATTRRFGTILENVHIDIDSRHLDLDDQRYTENTRAAYPVTYIPNAIYPGFGGHPTKIIMLTADAFGVLPPIAKLTKEQAMYHFISGYTAKVAGTEKGVIEPTPTFSACFGAPFMALHPAVYAELLGKNIQHDHVHCWLINTGWTGGSYGSGERIHLPHTRAMLNAALDGELDDIPMHRDEFFHLHVPESCPGVPTGMLQPANTWSDQDAYEATARKLCKAFRENFEKFADVVSAEVRDSGPGCD